MPRQGHLTAEALTAFGLVLLPAGLLFALLAPLPWAAYPMTVAALLYALCRLLLMLLLGELRDEVAPSLAEALEVAQRWELRCPLNATVTRRISRLQRLARQQPSRRIKPLWTGLVDAVRTTALGFRTVRETLNAAVPPRWAAPLRRPGCG